MCEPQIGPVSEALLEPAPLDVTLDCSWAGEAGCTGEDEEAGAGEPRVGEENSRRLNGTLPDQRHQQPYTVAGASGRPGQHTLVPAAPYAAGGGAGGGGGGRLVAVPPPRAMRLAVVGLEVMPDLVQRSLESKRLRSDSGHGVSYRCRSGGHRPASFGPAAPFQKEHPASRTMACVACCMIRQFQVWTAVLAIHCHALLT